MASTGDGSTVQSSKPKVATSASAADLGKSTRTPISGLTPLKTKLSSTQRRALRVTWKHMREGSGGVQVMERIFEKLIAERPKVKDVFYKAAFLGMFTTNSNGQANIITVRDHGKLLGKMFDDIVASLEQVSQETISKEIRDLGAKHAFMKSAGFKPEIWEKFGEVAVEIIGNQDVIKQTQDAMYAWTVVLACVTDEIRYGFEQHCKVLNRQGSIPSTSANDPLY